MDNEGLRDLLPSGIDLIFTIRFTKIGIIIEVKSSAVLCRLKIRNLKSTCFFIKIVISVIIVEKCAVFNITAISENDLITGINTDKLTDRVIYAYAFFLGIHLIGYTREHVSDTRINDYISHIHLKRRTRLRTCGIVRHLAVRLAVIHLHLNANTLGASESILIRSLKIKNKLSKLCLRIVITPGDSVSRIKILCKSSRTCGSRLGLATRCGSLSGCLGRESYIRYRRLRDRCRNHISNLGRQSYICNISREIRNIGTWLERSEYLLY